MLSMLNSFYLMAVKFSPALFVGMLEIVAPVQIAQCFECLLQDCIRVICEFLLVYYQF